MSKPSETDHYDRQGQVIALWMNGDSWTEIAEKLNISRKTIWVWRNEEQFIKRLEEANNRWLREIDSQSHFYVNEAIKTLHEVSQNSKSSQSEKIAACDKLLSHLLRIK